MTDIVERLRDADHVRLVAGAHWGTLCTEAADEIVQLEKPNSRNSHDKD